jgi:ketosteroid isomerase-like protein
MLILTSSFTVGAQSKASVEQDEVRKLERAWLDAYERRDVTAMNVIVADDFTITFPDGGMQTKTQIVESLKRPGGASMKFFTENVRSRSYGDTVILIGIVISEWMQNGEKRSDRSRYTDTYVRRGGKWQVVASHLSNAPK